MKFTNGNGKTAARKLFKVDNHPKSTANFLPINLMDITIGLASISHEGNLHSSLVIAIAFDNL